VSGGVKPCKILVSQHLLLGHGGARQAKKGAGGAHVQEDVYDPKDLRRKHWWWRALFVKSIAQSLIGARELSISLAALAPPQRQEPVMSSHDRSNATLAFRQLRLEEIVVRKHIHTACLFILAMVGSGAVLVNLKTVLVPFTMALMLFYSLVPIVDALSVPSERNAIKIYSSQTNSWCAMCKHLSLYAHEPTRRRPHIHTHAIYIYIHTYMHACNIRLENTDVGQTTCAGRHRPCDRHHLQVLKRHDEGAIMEEQEGAGEGLKCRRGGGEAPRTWKTGY
jgi:hypothetical protein